MGHRWIAHQHFGPEPALLAWASENGVHLVTTVRHPGDVLVSLYHYALNYAEEYADESNARPRIYSFLSPPDGKRTVSAMQGVEEQIAAYVRTEFSDELSISLRWLQCDVAHPVRYEDLWLDPVTTLDLLTSRIAVVSQRAIEHAIAQCDIAMMRRVAGNHAKFFRKGGIGEWRAALPAKIIEMLRSVAPYPAQFAALGYTLDPHDPIYTIPRQRSLLDNPFEDITHFDNGVLVAPIIVRLFLAAESAVKEPWLPVVRTESPDSFYTWLNAPAADDPAGAEGALHITNLGLYLYRLRQDVQAAFPDVFGVDRTAFLCWYCRVAPDEYGISDLFIAPVRSALQRACPSLVDFLSVAAPCTD